LISILLPEGLHQRLPHDESRALSYMFVADGVFRKGCACSRLTLVLPGFPGVQGLAAETSDHWQWQ